MIKVTQITNLTRYLQPSHQSKMLALYVSANIQWLPSNKPLFEPCLWPQNWVCYAKSSSLFLCLNLTRTEPQYCHNIKLKNTKKCEVWTHLWFAETNNGSIYSGCWVFSSMSAFSTFTHLGWMCPTSRKFSYWTYLQNAQWEDIWFFYSYAQALSWFRLKEHYGTILPLK